MLGTGFKVWRRKLGEGWAGRKEGRGGKEEEGDVGEEGKRRGESGESWEVIGAVICTSEW